MTIQHALSQLLNGLQLGVLLFLLAAGLTLVFGIVSLRTVSKPLTNHVDAYAAQCVMKAL